MSGGWPPIWLTVLWSISMTAAVFWQPRWMHRFLSWWITDDPHPELDRMDGRQ